MLQLRSLKLTHYKNYHISSFDFSKKVVAIHGMNGAGKTNLLDAIYYCCFTKSYFTTQDNANTSFGREGFRLEGDFYKLDQQQKVVCINRSDAKKEFQLNEVSYDKLSQHIGAFPAVMIAPDDINMITGSSENRRKFIDSLLCQTDEEYLRQLMRYNKVLLQRNSLLKTFAEQGKIDDTLLDILNDQLAKPGIYVFEKRKALMTDMLQSVQNIYHELAENAEAIGIGYQSKLEGNKFEQILKENKQKDLAAQRTTAGVHRDDLGFTLNGQVFKNVASQGQRKSLLFALKLAAFEILKAVKHFPPILLLDDVFEKLDEKRILQLLTIVCLNNDGQVFITDTHGERLEKAFEKIGIEVQLIELSEK